MAMLTERYATLQYGHLPLRERVLDELADVLFAVDTILDALRVEEARDIQWVEPEVRRWYEEVNALMLRMSQ